MPDFLARYEFKYLLRPDQQDWVRDMARMFCDPDANSANGSYDVWSLYFDTWDWKLAMQTIEGQRNRYKLRVRTYGFEPSDDVFLEIKRRVGTSILKQRAVMNREHVDAVCRGDAPPATGFQAVTPNHQPDLNHFRDRLDLEDLRPRLWVAYKREAWASRYADGSRVTFDTLPRSQPPDPESPFKPCPHSWQHIQLDGPPVILELKFNGAFPQWMQRIVTSLGLQRVSCSKYVQSAEQTGDVPWTRIERRDAWTLS